MKKAQAPWPPTLSLCVGTMNWGRTVLDKRVSGYVIPQADIDEIVRLALDNGVTCFDTAEGYGGGSSEECLGEALQRVNPADPSAICSMTKFLPTLWRWRKRSFLRALDKSNRRLGVECCELYFIHSPVHPLPVETWVRAAAIAIKRGKMKRLGLSNFNAEQVRRACTLARQLGVPIVANQIQLNLLTAASPRLQETVVECQRQNIRVIAYSPLAQGLLAKPEMTAEQAEKVRLTMITGLSFDSLRPLRETIKKIAANHSSKAQKHSMSHVCLAWVRAKGAIPIVGVRKPEHLNDALASLPLKLTDEEVRLLDAKAFGKHTFEKPKWRRSLFIVFISGLMIAYRVSRSLHAQVET